jgi:small neutral amino acid transporter SnatA (MarC family)
MKIRYHWLWRVGFALLVAGSLARILGAPPVAVWATVLGLLLVVISLYRKPGDGQIPPRV